ncbi:MAG TPA: rhomboid family intramembrane serine protease [Gemmatimonadaceae bacterium]|nr:rhomboid family intramembrane serine protease [Gemmatimonadaceae bacterium]
MTPWVRRLIVANIVMFGLQTFVPGLTQVLEFLPAAVLYRPWTIITYMFLHGSIMHILFNMIALYYFGMRVEERLGGPHFMTLYLLSGIGGALLSLGLAPFVPIIGASGAIMGVMMAYAMYWPRDRMYIWGVLPVESWLLVGIYVLLDIGGFGAGIAHFAHLGGFATGFLYLKWLDFRSPARAWRKRVSGPGPRRPIGNGDPLRAWREIRLDDLHPINRDEIVRLLHKAQAEGAGRLTPEERATLDRFAGIS